MVVQSICFVISSLLKTKKSIPLSGKYSLRLDVNVV